MTYLRVDAIQPQCTSVAPLTHHSFAILPRAAQSCKAVQQVLVCGQGTEFKDAIRLRKVHATSINLDCLPNFVFN